MQHPRRKTIGIRVPDHRIALALLAELGEPLMSTTLRLPDSDLPLNDPDEIFECIGHRVDLVIDSGACGLDSTTVVDMSADPPAVLRAGLGDTALFG